MAERTAAGRPAAWPERARGCRRRARRLPRRPAPRTRRHRRSSADRRPSPSSCLLTTADASRPSSTTSSAWPTRSCTVGCTCSRRRRGSTSSCRAAAAGTSSIRRSRRSCSCRSSPSSGPSFPQNVASCLFAGVTVGLVWLLFGRFALTVRAAARADRGLRLRDGLLVRRRGRLGLVPGPRLRGHVQHGRGAPGASTDAGRSSSACCWAWPRSRGCRSRWRASACWLLRAAASAGRSGSRADRAAGRSDGRSLFGAGHGDPGRAVLRSTTWPAGARSWTRATRSSRACSRTRSTSSTGSSPSSTSRATSTRSSCSRWNYVDDPPFLQPTWWGLGLFLTTPLLLWLVRARLQDPRVLGLGRGHRPREHPDHHPRQRRAGPVRLPLQPGRPGLPVRHPGDRVRARDVTAGVASRRSRRSPSAPTRSGRSRSTSSRSSRYVSPARASWQGGVEHGASAPMVRASAQRTRQASGRASPWARRRS